MQVLFILNDAPYGSERTYNALRLADVLLKIEEDLALTIFLVGDAVGCARAGQKTATGYYNVERMLHGVLTRGQVLVCETCMEARGLTDEDLIPRCRRAKYGELGQLVLEADKVLVY
jgi:uncharacterized protein involved in oxidation of intracellular sulfur